jgi:hypothetical protein
LRRFVAGDVNESYSTVVALCGFRGGVVVRGAG